MIQWAEGQELLGEYLIDREIAPGQGGMGRVWLVTSKSTGRQFAVKQTKLKDENSRKTFLAELQTWIDLPEHPNIVPCRFFRTVGDEIVIFTDYIEGGSLADWIAKGKLTSLEQILDVAIQFAWGLHAIHERGFIHQDVKPGNVLMTADGVPMVADFGLARARQVAPDGQFVSPDLASGQQSVLVSVGGMTPAYASPEQKARQPLSRKTDIWSWGVSVLDMFMGGVSCPHGGYIAADVLEAFKNNGGQEAGLPKMPDAAADILRKCFVRDPAERWVNLDDAVADVKSLYQKVTGRAYLQQQRHDISLVKIVKHDRQVLYGVVEIAPREWLRAAYVANGRNPADADSYQVPVAYSRKGAIVADLAIIEEAEKQFNEAMSGGNSKVAAQFAELFFGKAVVCMSVDDARGCVAAADQSIIMYRRLVEQEGRRELAVVFARVLMNVATMYIAMGNLAVAVKHCDECISILRCLVEKEGQRTLADDLAMALMNKAAAISGTGDLVSAANLYAQCIPIYQWLVGQGGRRDLAYHLAEALMSKGVVLQNMGNLEGATKLYDESIAIYRRLVEQEGRLELAKDFAAALMNKANVLCDLGHMLRASAMYDESIAIYRRLVEQEGRQELVNILAKVLMNNATALGSIGNLAAALKVCDEGIAIYRRLVEQEGRLELGKDYADILMNKAIIQEKMGDMAGAIDSYDKCISMYQRLVEQEGRKELLGDLSWAQLNRASAIRGRLLVELEGRKDISRDLSWAQRSRASVARGGHAFAEWEVVRQQARKAYHALANEAQRTGRADLKGAMEWAQEAFRNLI